MVNNLQIKHDKREIINESDNISPAEIARGDIIGLHGIPGRTKAGELSLIASKCKLLSQCNYNMPMMNWTHTQTLKDSELRFQK